MHADRLTGIDQIRVFDLRIRCSEPADLTPDSIVFERTVKSHRYFAQGIAGSNHHSGRRPSYFHIIFIIFRDCILIVRHGSSESG